MRKLTDDIPMYSEEGRDAIELLHLDYASFFFYFEDAHHESVYERFIEKLFPKINGAVTICLGGKTKVITKAKQDRFPNIKSIFIVDLDYDNFLGKIEKIPDLFYFEKFSFENYLTEKNALINISIDENSRNLTKLKANSEYIDFATFREKLINQLIKLTKIHLVVRKYSIPIESTKVSCNVFLDDSDLYPIPSDTKIQSYLDRVLSACESSKNKEWLSNEESFRSEGERIFSTLNSSHDIDLSDYCCGKHLLGCTVRYFDAKLEKKLASLDSVNMYIRLLSVIDIKIFSKFKDELINTYKWKH